MFDYAMSLVQEKLNFLANTTKTEIEVYLGVSNISDEIRAFLCKHGWKAFYIEHGHFQLYKL